MDQSSFDDDPENVEFRRLQGRYSSLKKQNFSLQKRVEELEQANATQAADLKKAASASHQIKELQRQNQVLRMNLHSAEKRVKKSGHSNSSLVDRLKHLQGLYRERMTEITTLLSKLEEVNAVVRDLQETNQNHDDEVQKWRKKYVYYIGCRVIYQYDSFNSCV